MAVPKPTFVLVPGAWHPVSCYNVLCEELSAAGYPVQVAELPSLDPRDPSAVSCAKDAEAVRKILISLIEEDKHVVVVPHSYGGIPGGCGAYGLGKSAREKEGKKGGVIGLIYMSAFVVPEGSSLLEFLGGKYPFYVQENTVCVKSPEPKIPFFSCVIASRRLICCPILTSTTTALRRSHAYCTYTRNSL